MASAAAASAVDGTSTVCNAEEVLWNAQAQIAGC